MVGVFRSFQVFTRDVGKWWHEPVDYPGQVQYFARRSLASAIRVLIGAGIGLMALISIAVLLPVIGQDSTASRVAVTLFATLTTVWSIVWCSRTWPSRRVSRAFIVSADVGITVVALLGSSWPTGLFALNCFALISVYLMFFDGAKALTLHSALILATTAAFTAQVPAGDSLSRTSLTATVLGAVLPTIATPLGIQFGIWTLRNDANESVTDPLTGLLNRRGLHLHFASMLSANRTSSAALIVVVVDLDRFKDINDKFGHPTGDKVLIHCARRISETVGQSALVARIGGEEFVVVQHVDRHRDDQLPERIRLAIAAPGETPSVTASLGVTDVAYRQFAAPDSDHVRLLDDILARADVAMFDAKHVGGNTIRRA